jgi:peptidoglycan/xylan/chitin deacetylase (PgdA/CDA1 family)
MEFTFTIVPQFFSLSRCSATLLVCVLEAAPSLHSPALAKECQKTIYLTFDTGNMSQAEHIASVLKRHEVRATFFLANEKTNRGDFALDPSWQPYWASRAAEGHVFGSHTFDHVYFRGESTADAMNGKPQFGSKAGQAVRWNDGDFCAELNRVRSRFQSLTGHTLSPLWRAPGGRAPKAVMASAEKCGYQHVFWADAGFLGDELPSESHPNSVLLARALANLKDGDITMAHLGIWSRREPWAPAVLEPLILGLKQKNYCFATLKDHPAYKTK